MNPRFAKEIRPLLLPWSIAAILAAGHLVARADNLFAKGEFGSLLTGLAGLGFFVGCLILTAMPVGFELHEHTLGLLVSQPMDRVRLWRQKLAVAALAVLALSVVHGLASSFAGQLRWQEALACFAFMAMAVCSVGYFTLATGSVFIGIACAVSIPLWVAFSIHLFVYYLLGIELSLSEQMTLLLGAILCAGYCGLFLWLGRRQFRQLELKAGGAGRLAQIPQALIPAKLTEAFRSRPTGATLNLIRKEICLQRPVFLVSAIFTAGWLMTLLVMLVRPTWHDNYVAVFNGLTGTQVVLMAILTGCVSLGDDKAFGTVACHLALPVSARRQWLIKLFVAFATLVGVAFVLPTLLALLTLFKARVGLLAIPAGEGMDLMIPCVLVFLVSFWSTSMVTSTVRGALTTLLALLLIGFAARTGLALGTKTGGLQSTLVSWLLAEMQRLPASFPPANPFTFLLGAGVLATALTQSFRQFRRLDTRLKTTIRDLVIVIGLVFAIAIWRADYDWSSPRSPLLQSVRSALRSLSFGQLPLDRSVTLAPLDLERTGRLSFLSKRWLRNSTIEVRRLGPVPKPPSRIRGQSYLAVISLPSGRSTPLGWTVAEPDSQPQGEKK